MYHYPLDNLETSIGLYYDAILNKNQSLYETTSHNLFKRLLQEPLEDNNGINHLIFISDNILAGIPFETLLTRSSNPLKPGINKSFLIQDYELSYHYSAELLVSNFLAGSPFNKNSFIGFAPGDLYNTQYTTSSNEKSEGKPDLLILPGAEMEVHQIVDLLDGTFMTGNDATEYNFKNSITQTNILHVASHATIDLDEPLYSKLYFTPAENNQEDGVLHAYELYNMDIKALMVSLSACNTMLFTTE